MQCCEKMRDAVGEENVLIGEPVTEIDQSDEDMVRVTTATGKEFKCRYVINATPLHISGEFLYNKLILKKLKVHVAILTCYCYHIIQKI